MVVDDGSTDRTSEVAKSAGIQVLRHASNLGKGAALNTGFDYATKKGLEAVITLDADNQHRPEEIINFIEYYSIHEPHLIVGHRRIIKNMPFHRLATNRITSLVVSLLGHVRVPDSQCGFRLIRTDLLRKIRLRTSRFEMESELIVEAARNGFQVSSVLIETIYTGGGSHVHPIIDTLRFIRLAIRLLWR